MHLQRYIEHKTSHVFRFGPDSKWPEFVINALRGITCLSVVGSTLAVANNIWPQLLWAALLVISAFSFGGLFVWDREPPQLRDTEQELVDVGSETPSLSKSPEQTSDEDADR